MILETGGFGVGWEIFEREAPAAAHPWMPSVAACAIIDAVNQDAAAGRVSWNKPSPGRRGEPHVVRPSPPSCACGGGFLATFKLVAEGLCGGGWIEAGDEWVVGWSFQARQLGQVHLHPPGLVIQLVELRSSAHSSILPLIHWSTHCSTIPLPLPLPSCLSSSCGWQSTTRNKKAANQWASMADLASYSPGAAQLSQRELGPGGHVQS